jgi:hypothetical protein
VAPVNREITKPKRAVIRWLLDSDPSIRWQVMRDLTGESDEAVAAERSRVAIDGWGARLLSLHCRRFRNMPRSSRGMVKTTWR